MIRYTLRCDQGHEFEGWFKNSGEFDKQLGKRQLACPDCSSLKVEKALMAPALGRSEDVPAPPEKIRVAAPDPRKQALIEALREIRKTVTENAEYVGDRFPEEARKIHYQEVEPRGIYGEATLEEAKDLYEEGVDFHPVPVVPDDLN